MNILVVAAILLLPLIPTVIIYKFIKDRRSRAGAHGTLLGVEFETGGAVATYVIVCLLAFLAFRISPPGPGVVQVGFRLHPVSSSDSSLMEFLQHRTGSVQLTLEREGREPLIVRNFQVSNGTVLDSEQSVPYEDLGEQFNVSTRPATLLANVRPKVLRLGRQNDIEVELKAQPERQDWITALDLKSVFFSEGGTKLRLREIFVLSNPGPEPLESAFFNGYVGMGDVLTMEVSARQVSSDDMGILVRRWSRNQLQGQGVDEILKRFDGEWSDLPRLGREIGFRRLINQDFAELVQQPRIERGQLRVDSTSPVVGPIAGGVGRDEGLVLTVEITSLYRSIPLRSGEEDHLGTLFERFCERALLIAYTDGSLEIDGSRIRMEFKEKVGQVVASIGDPIQRTSDTAAIVDLAGIGAADVARMYWVWRDHEPSSQKVAQEEVPDPSS